MNGITPVSFNSNFQYVIPLKSFSSGVSFKANENLDTVDLISKNNNVEPARIGVVRLFFKYLNDEQVNAINRSGKLPENAKFIPKSDGTGYRIHNNFFGVRSGTRIIPAGYEVRRNWLGFAIVVPKGTEGLFIRSVKDSI